MVGWSCVTCFVRVGSGGGEIGDGGGGCAAAKVLALNTDGQAL